MAPTCIRRAVPGRLRPLGRLAISLDTSRIPYILNGVTVDQLTALVDASDARYLGLRSVYSLTGEALPVAVGETLPASYWWDDNESTGVLLDGTCAIEIDRNRPETIALALSLIESYSGGTVVLVGSDYTGQDAPSDPGEIILRDPVVLAVLS